MRFLLNWLFPGMNKVKLIVGHGDLKVPSGWVVSDLPELDVTCPEHWPRFLKGRTLEMVFAEHVWEHLTPAQAQAANKNIFNVLKPGGNLRIAVPDGNHPDQGYIEHVRPGGTGPGAHDHKILYTASTMTAALREAGFHVELLEYWDEKGAFHYKDWDPGMGKVLRSRNFDTRNAGGKLNYTSLIVDARKPG